MSKYYNIFKKSILSILTIVLIVSTFCFAGVAYADNQDDPEVTYPPSDTSETSLSIVKDLFMGIMQKRVVNGNSAFPIDGAWEDKRQDLNYHIAKEDASTTYSLYDRFGGNVNFSQYIGETPVKTNLMDNLYTMIKTSDFNNFKIENVLDLFKRKDTEFNNAFYDGRPLLKSSSMDPRTKRWTLLPIIDGISLAGANYLLDTAKIVTTVATYFVTPDLINTAITIIQGVFEQQLGAILKSLLNVLLALAGAALILFLIKCAYQCIKGKVSVKKVIINFVIGLLNIGLITILIINPLLFLDFTKKALTFGDIVATEATKKFLETTPSPEISDSGINDNIIKASLWQKAIFEPWVQAEFGGTKYEDLYTTYSDTGNKWEVSDDASKAYGDAKVPVGNGKEIKNWAALAYSCHSIYHLNATEKTEMTDDPHEKEKWPKAETPTNHTSIYTDDFRWIDASLKVGQYGVDSNGKKADKITDPYVDYREYWFLGWTYGGRAIWMSLLLIPLGFIGFKRFKAGLICVISALRILVINFQSLMQPSTNDARIKEMLKAFFLPCIDYLFYSITIVIALMIYFTLGASDSLFIQIIYLCLVIIVAKLTPQNVYSGARDFQGSIKHAKEKAKRWHNDNITRGHDLSLIDRIERKGGRLPYNVKDLNANWGPKATGKVGNLYHKNKHRQDMAQNRRRSNSSVSDLTIFDYNQAKCIPEFGRIILQKRIIKDLKSSTSDLAQILTEDQIQAILNAKQAKIVKRLWEFTKNQYYRDINQNSNEQMLNAHRTHQITIMLDWFLFDIPKEKKGIAKAGNAYKGIFSNMERLDAKQDSAELDQEYLEREISALENKLETLTGNKSDRAKRKQYEKQIKTYKRQQKGIARRIKGIRKDKKAEKVQDTLTQVLGKKMPFASIPLRLKVKIVLIALAIYGIGLLIYMILGAA